MKINHGKILALLNSDNYQDNRQAFELIGHGNTELSHKVKNRIRTFPFLCLKYGLELDYFNQFRMFPPYQENVFLFGERDKMRSGKSVDDFADAVRHLLGLPTTRFQKVPLDDLFEELPEAIGQLTNLSILDLSHCQLAKIPEAIGQLTRLKCLILGNNVLTSLPHALKNLTQLKILDLSANYLSEFPAVLYHLSQLEELSLGENRFTELPADIDRLQLLKVLHLYTSDTPLPNLDTEPNYVRGFIPHHLRYNKMKTLPASLGKLKYLEYLDASNNEISELPAGLEQATNLQVLLLAHNKLSSFPKFVEKLTQLHLLDLGNNPIKTIPKKVFNQLPLLEYLGLAATGLSSLPASVGNLKLLSCLDLGKNSIKRLPANLKKINGKPLSFGAYLRMRLGQLQGKKEEKLFRQASVYWGVQRGHLASGSMAIENRLLRKGSLKGNAMWGALANCGQGHGDSVYLDCLILTGNPMNKSKVEKMLPKTQLEMDG